MIPDCRTPSEEWTHFTDLEVNTTELNQPFTEVIVTVLKTSDTSQDSTQRRTSQPTIC